MTRTASTMIPLGSSAPDFTLTDPLTRQNVGLKIEPPPPATVIMFICNHCPFVKHIIPSVVAFADEFQARGARFIAINSNDISQFPEDAPDKMARFASHHQFNFPYLFDETQETAKEYQAVCTPDFFVFDAQYRCVYRGRYDASRPDNKVEVTGQNLRIALENTLTGGPIAPEQRPSLGCNIKWKRVSV
jgi:thiol-disulfide isomerase/thioredoxin